MKKILALPTALLLSLSPSAWSEGDRSEDLRYCLELESPSEIAKCAGEIAPGPKGKPYSQEQVEQILEEEKRRAPVRMDEAPQAPATETETNTEKQPATDSPPVQTEGN